MLTADDRFAITELINSHGHLTDSGDLEGLLALFTEDVVYDVSALGGGVLVGPESIREATLSLGDANPVAHHVTNIVFTEAHDSRAHTMSKGLGIMTDGTLGSVTYEDTFERTTAGWRLTHRIIRPRRVPLRP
ncbi:nuclear transport factor 2 family protein [Nocardia sp. NPDC019395]|uniref:nuclear transport factor 2 family protein n=1 Tax=Nocardia sp. NPDC019395 TaxID=3154686 RepID=UPI0033C50149